MAIKYSSIAGCGDTKMTYLRSMCDKNNIKVKITSNISKQDTISCRFSKGLTELCLEMPSSDFLSNTIATEHRLVMLVGRAFRARIPEDCIKMIFQHLQSDQKGGANG